MWGFKLKLFLERGSKDFYFFLGGKFLYDILCSESSKPARICLMARQYFVVGGFFNHDEFCHLSLNIFITKLTKNYLCYLHDATVPTL